MKQPKKMLREQYNVEYFEAIRIADQAGSNFRKMLDEEIQNHVSQR
jgi:hypothetical protein